MNIVFYKTEKISLKEALKNFNPHSIVSIEEGVISGFCPTLRHTIDKIYDLEFDFIENSLREIHIKSNIFNEVFYGSSTLETLMELTVFNFGFNQEDIEPVEFHLKGIIKNLNSAGFYLLKERKEFGALYQGVEVGEDIYFYFKRNDKEEILIESSSGSIKRRTVN